MRVPPLPRSPGGSRRFLDAYTQGLSTTELERLFTRGTLWLITAFGLPNLIVLLEVADRLTLKNDLEIARDILQAMLPRGADEPAERAAVHTCAAVTIHHLLHRDPRPDHWTADLRECGAEPAAAATRGRQL